MTDSDLNRKKNEQYEIEKAFVEPKRLRRSNENKILLGVCGGIAEYLDFSPVIVRFFFMLTILIGGWGIIFYFIVALFIPKKIELVAQTSPNLDEINYSNKRFIWGAVFILVGFYFIIDTYGIIQYFSFAGIPPQIFWAVAAIATGIYIFITRDLKVNCAERKMIFTRSKIDRRFMGVCGGFAKYLQVDSNLIRMIWLIISFSTLGLAILIYLIIAFYIPINQDEIIVEQTIDT